MKNIEIKNNKKEIDYLYNIINIINCKKNILQVLAPICNNKKNLNND
jgi:hypothetical protein